MLLGVVSGGYVPGIMPEPARRRPVAPEFGGKWSRAAYPESATYQLSHGPGPISALMTVVSSVGM